MSWFSIPREQYIWVFFKIGLKVCNFIKKRLRHRCVTVNIAASNNRNKIYIYFKVEKNELTK